MSRESIATALGALFAVALTVTPGIQNRVLAGVFWTLTGVCAAWWWTVHRRQQNHALTLSWIEIEQRFHQLREREIVVADGGRGDRFISALTHAERGEREQWTLMGGNRETRADAERLCRIAGSKLKAARWQRPERVTREPDDFNRWLWFVADVGGYERDLHSTSSGRSVGAPSERWDFWIHDLVPECVAACRECIARGVATSNARRGR